MRIDPSLLTEFRDWMRNKLKDTIPVKPEMVEVRALIEMMKRGQWPMIADISDKTESDVIGNVDFDPDELMELDEYERPYYEEFLREYFKG